MFAESSGPTLMLLKKTTNQENAIVELYSSEHYTIALISIAFLLYIFRFKDILNFQLFQLDKYLKFSYFYLS